MMCQTNKDDLNPMNNLEQPHIVNHDFKWREMKKFQKKIPLVQVGGKKGVQVAIGTGARKKEVLIGNFRILVLDKRYL